MSDRLNDALTLEELDRDGALREAAHQVEGDTRAAFFRKGGAFVAGGLALSALPIAFASGAGVPSSDVKILNYALTLEYLESAFYAEAVSKGALKGEIASFAQTVAQHEAAHVAALEKALDQDIQTLPWMSDETKKQANLKLAAIRNKIGYPEVWRDYTRLNVERGDLIGNFARANEFEARRQIAKIGKPLDRKEWGMTPPTVNAYYSGSYNEIVFPAGILQPPFFDKNMDDAVNFGGIGVVIGHELTHGFDDSGRKFDPQGNLRDWWTEQDGKEFEKRASCVADEYSSFIAVDDLHLSGRLTLGENTADNGGARIALMALRKMIAADPTGKAAQKIDGYSPEQRFFLGFARVWCEKQRPEFARTRVNTDPHSPGRYRVNGVVQNMPEFHETWNCKPGQAMVRADPCRVW